MLFATPRRLSTLSAVNSNERPMKVVVVGAGVAGLAVAYALMQPEVAERFEVRIIEKRNGEERSGTC
jgi:cation diffusion facilitator CzcD-associated flavoprotein CzcO